MSVDTVCEDLGQVFNVCASACPRTCADLSSVAECIEVAEEDCVPTCVCPAGMLEQDGQLSSTANQSSYIGYIAAAAVL